MALRKFWAYGKSLEWPIAIQIQIQTNPCNGNRVIGNDDNNDDDDDDDDKKMMMMMMMMTMMTMMMMMIKKIMIMIWWWFPNKDEMKNFYFYFEYHAINNLCNNNDNADCDWKSLRWVNGKEK